MKLFILLVLFLLFEYIKSLNFNLPLCKNCKSFIPISPDNNISGFCKIFVNEMAIKNKEKIIFNNAEHCRDNEYLCGESGWLFEDINDNSEKDIDDNTQIKIDMDYLCEIKINEIENIIINIEHDEYKKKFTNDEIKFFNYYLKNYAKYNTKKKY
jgi:hypothetical protein